MRKLINRVIWTLIAIGVLIGAIGGFAVYLIVRVYGGSSGC